MSTGFTQNVLAYVRDISSGTVRSYKAVATAVGSPQAARAVGSVMRKNKNPDIPCHRVIRSDGTAGEYNRGGPKAKQRLLKEEGVNVKVRADTSPNAKTGSTNTK